MGLFVRDGKSGLIPIPFRSGQGEFEKVWKAGPIPTPNADLRQPLKMAILRKPLINMHIAFRTSFGPGPNRTENQGANRERKAGKMKK